jgi:hypothetical protein
MLVATDPQAVRQSFEGMLQRHERERQFYLEHFRDLLTAPGECHDSDYQDTRWKLSERNSDAPV